MILQHWRTHLHSLLHPVREIRVHELEGDDSILHHLHPISGSDGDHGPLCACKTDNTILFMEPDGEEVVIAYIMATNEDVNR